MIRLVISSVDYLTLLSFSVSHFSYYFKHCLYSLTVCLSSSMLQLSRLIPSPDCYCEWYLHSWWNPCTSWKVQVENLLRWFLFWEIFVSFRLFTRSQFSDDIYNIGIISSNQFLDNRWWLILTAFKFHAIFVFVNEEILLNFLKNFSGISSYLTSS